MHESSTARCRRSASCLPFEMRCAGPRRLGRRAGSTRPYMRADLGHRRRHSRPVRRGPTGGAVRLTDSDHCGEALLSSRR
eukprot:scaffold1939_cov392-Prasinococcus_capsulatus_cf.AAC.12